MRARPVLLTLTVVAGLAVIPVIPASAATVTFANCTAMHHTYEHGVGRAGAHDKTSGKAVAGFKVSTKIYNANRKSDRDKDGIACEA